MISVRKILLLVLGLILVCLSPRTFAAQLKAVTAQAFQQYTDLTEARIRGEVSDPNRFLQFDSLPDVQRLAMLSRLRKGAVLIEPVMARKNEASIEIPDGLVHHWLAIGFIPGVTVEQVLTLAQDYPRYAEIYKPDVQRTDIISHEGQQFRVYYRFYRHAIVTAVFNTEFVIDYSTPDTFHAYSFARTVHIAEVENPGKTNEKEYPVGNDHGYLWRFNLYTRYLERDNGVYIQIEFLALSRTVPAIFTWLVNPYLGSIPRQYLTQYIQATRTALTPSNAYQSGVGRRQSETGGLPTKRAVHFLRVASAGTQARLQRVGLNPNHIRVRSRAAVSCSQVSTKRGGILAGCRIPSFCEAKGKSRLVQSQIVVVTCREEARYTP